MSSAFISFVMDLQMVLGVALLALVVCAGDCGVTLGVPLWSFEVFRIRHGHQPVGDWQSKSLQVFDDDFRNVFQVIPAAPVAISKLLETL